MKNATVLHLEAVTRSAATPAHPPPEILPQARSLCIITQGNRWFERELRHSLNSRKKPAGILQKTFASVYECVAAAGSVVVIQSPVGLDLVASLSTYHAVNMHKPILYMSGDQPASLEALSLFRARFDVHNLFVAGPVFRNPCSKPFSGKKFASALLQRPHRNHGPAIGDLKNTTSFGSIEKCLQNLFLSLVHLEIELGFLPAAASDQSSGSRIESILRCAESVIRSTDLRVDAA